MAQRFDSKIEEVKSEMKFLTGRIEWVNTKRRGKLESGKIDKTNSVVKEIHNSFAAFDLTCFLLFSSAQRHQQPPSHRQHAHETGTNQQEVGRGEEQMHEGRQELPQDANGERKSEKFNWALACVVWQEGKMKRKWKLLVGGRKEKLSVLLWFLLLLCTHLRFAIFHWLHWHKFSLHIFLRHLRHPARKDLWSCRGQLEEIIHERSLDVLKNAVYSFKAVFVLPFIARWILSIHQREQEKAEKHSHKFIMLSLYFFLLFLIS